MKCEEAVKREETIASAARCEIPAYPRMDLVLVRGEKARVFDINGKAYLDLYGGHAVCIAGHSHPRIVEAIARQAQEILFYSNVVHLPVRARAAERLCRIAPWRDGKAFFVNSGSEANETALKIARQMTGRSRVVSFEGGFHGRTLGALAACGMEHYRHPSAALLDAMNAFTRATFNDVGGLERGIDASVAAVLVEPIQSMGGVRVLTPEFARALRARCDATGALLIFDEIQTAPGRTGFWFAGERWGVQPDMITMAKGVGGGFPASVVLARGAVAATVKPGDQGTTFGGGPLACAAIDATLQVLEEIEAPARAREIEAFFRHGLQGCGRIEEIRGLGGLLGVRVRGDAAEAQRTLQEREHVLVGGCPGDRQVLRLFPPLTMERAELDESLEKLRSVLA